jgi:hypothetical protein
MKQPHGRPRVGIDGGHFGPFVPIAGSARIGQVVLGGHAAVLAAEDVVHLVVKPGIFFRDQAVLTTATGSKGYRCPELVTNITGHERE